jgi:hypothetical protein
MKRLLPVLSVFLLFSCGTAKPVYTGTAIAERNAAYEAGFKKGLERGKALGYYEAAKSYYERLCLYRADALALASGREAVLEGTVKTAVGRAPDGRLYAESYFEPEKLSRLAGLYAPYPDGFKSRWCGRVPEPPSFGPACSYSNPVLQLACKTGERAGEREGRTEGRRLAREDFLSVMAELKNDFFLLEKEKFLKGNLTYPRLWQGKEGKILVNPRVESIRTLSQILEFSSPALPDKAGRKRAAGIDLPDAEREKFLDSLPSDYVRKPYRIKVRGEEGDLLVLSKEGIAFEVEDGEVYAVFRSKREAREFCNKYPTVCTER